MKHVAIAFSKETGFSVFETSMRTTKDIDESCKHLHYPYLWAKIIIEESGLVVAEWSSVSNRAMQSTE